MKRRRLIGIVTLFVGACVLPATTACASDSGTSYSPGGQALIAESQGASPQARGTGSGGPAIETDRGAAPTAEVSGESDDEFTPTDDDASFTQHLVYSGSMILAIYNVTEIQDRAVELVEQMDGYVSRRTRDRLTIRVPAESFRDAMDALGELGDVLDTVWQAHDVTDEVRDLEIRLRNAIELRDRLEALLERAESVEDALEIESELERITLQIERIRGQLENMQRRIAYSTIEIEFRTIETEEVPDRRVRLPFGWLNELGLESLLAAPEESK